MFAIDAGSARDVLAMVLCPARAFAGTEAAMADSGDEEEAARILKSVKSALIRRFRARMRRRDRN